MPRPIGVHSNVLHAAFTEEAHASDRDRDAGSAIYSEMDFGGRRATGAIGDVSHVEGADACSEIGTHGPWQKVDLQSAGAAQNVRVRIGDAECLLVVELLEGEVDADCRERPEMHEQKALPGISALEVILGLSDRDDGATAEADAENRLFALSVRER